MKLNEHVVGSLEAPDRGNRVYYFPDAMLQGVKAPRGFGVRVTAAGARSFVLNYRVAHRERRFTIGQWPDWTALTAVREARTLRKRVDRGEDPLDDRRATEAASRGYVEGDLRGVSTKGRGATTQRTLARGRLETARLPQTGQPTDRRDQAQRHRPAARFDRGRKRVDDGGPHLGGRAEDHELARQPIGRVSLADRKRHGADAAARAGPQPYAFRYRIASCVAGSGDRRGPIRSVRTVSPVDRRAPL